MLKQCVLQHMVLECCLPWWLWKLLNKPLSVVRHVYIIVAHGVFFFFSSLLNFRINSLKKYQCVMSNLILVFFSFKFFLFFFSIASFNIRLIVNYASWFFLVYLLWGNLILIIRVTSLKVSLGYLLVSLRFFFKIDFFFNFILQHCFY